MHKGNSIESFIGFLSENDFDELLFVSDRVFKENSEENYSFISVVITKLD
jgi:hypothetical protein